MSLRSLPLLVASVVADEIPAAKYSSQTYPLLYNVGIVVEHYASEAPVDDSHQAPSILTPWSCVMVKVLLLTLDKLLIVSVPAQSVITSVALLPKEDNGYERETSGSCINAQENDVKSHLCSLPLPFAVKDIVLCDAYSDSVGICGPDSHMNSLNHWFTFATAAAAHSFVRSLQTVVNYHRGVRLSVIRVTTNDELQSILRVSTKNKSLSNETPDLSVPHSLWMSCNLTAVMNSERLAHVKSTFANVDAATKVVSVKIKDWTKDALARQRRQCTMYNSRIDALRRELEEDQSKAVVAARIEHQTCAVNLVVHTEEEELKTIQNHLTDEVSQWQQFLRHRQQEELRIQRRQQELENDRACVQDDFSEQKRAIERKCRVLDKKMEVYDSDEYSALEGELLQLQDETGHINYYVQELERKLSKVKRKQLVCAVDQTIAEYAALQKVAVDDDAAVELAFDVCHEAQAEHETLIRDCEHVDDSVAIARAALKAHTTQLQQEEDKLVLIRDSLVPIESKINDLQCNRDFFFSARDQKIQAEIERKDAEQEWVRMKVSNRDISISLAQELFRQKLKVRSASSIDCLTSPL